MRGLLTGVLCLIIFISFAQHPLVLSGKLSHLSGAHLNEETRSAACAPAAALRDLEWNNVSALIETGGTLWLDRAVGRSHYFVPKDGNVSVAYAGALWLGGISPDQQLKLAAVTYRAFGNDYWPGPLTNDGTASVSSDVCSDWDRFTITLRTDAQRHRAYFECEDDPECDLNTLFPQGYAIPSYFYDYPAIGNVSQGQDLYLAPFYDYDGDGFYSPEAGDYPWYDFLREINCAERRREDPVPLFGDQNYFWIFNDKGNAHTESQGQPIGMEIRAQAFAFSTNDEINNMTFYNYVLINQGTQTLQDTYFGTWIDCDIGGELDDYVGCDVQRGLGYAYNGNAFDGPTGLSPGYGANPPAMGVDFFEGPYQDTDGLDNPLTSDIAEAIELKGIPYKGIGIGYGDGVIDNERFGMRKFVFHNSGSAPNGFPENAVHFYNFLRGFWKNGQRMAYGGNALTAGSGADLSIFADYMFPGDSDPLNFGTLGTAVDDWTELSSGNQAADRRFLQSAGPFTLQPGDYNNITVGVVWARASGGTPFASVELLRSADDKAQALFDNCFELVSGPDAPQVEVRELDREIILFLSNDDALSSNYLEGYRLIDPTIPEVDEDGNPLSDADRSYVFQGYQIYQLSGPNVSSADLGDITRARLIAQCDVEDGISNIINFARDEETGLVTPSLMVSGADQGIQRSFRITSDAFAQGDNRLVNHKTYYFMALAYGYNEYRPYDVASGTGQDVPYLPSRKAVFGAIPVIAAIPHDVTPEAGGTTANASYGTGVFLTRIEGKGNGLNDLIITAESERDILENNFVPELTYAPNRGPVDIKVVDPLRVPAADFELRLLTTEFGEDEPDSMMWQLHNLTTDEIYDTYKSFAVASEDVILDWGLSIDWGQYRFLEDGVFVRHYTDLVSSSIEYADPSKPWLAGIDDEEGFTEFNWIRAGSVKTEGDDPQAVFERLYDDFEQGTGDFPFTDADELYETVVGGTWAPYCLVSFSADDPNTDGAIVNNIAPTTDDLKGDLDVLASAKLSNIRGLNNVDIVLTSDKSKWTRCPVLEMQYSEDLAFDNDGNNNMDPVKMKMRRSPSVDQNGNPDGTGTGMGWFPGYAIDVGTGERLNMAFGEDSWLVGENGRDMIWNPTSRLSSNIGAQPLAGGQHWIYVFKNLRFEDNNDQLMPTYDQGEYMRSRLDDPGLSLANWRRIFRACTWVGSGLLAPGYELLSPQQGLIPNDVRIRLRVGKPYESYAYNTRVINTPGESINGWRNLYRFSTKNIAPETNNVSTLTEALDMINVVPNPYYAFSQYETSKLDNRVKITNLPERCTVTIYDMNGTLIRQYNKADPLTSLDWDLKNAKNVPIASGTYIIHVDVPGAGEKILKWFGVMRPIDLDNF
jgi:hypothetical protein